MKDHQSILVLDVGGTKLAAGVMLADHTIHCRLETPTHAQAGAEAVLERLIKLGREVIRTFMHSQANRLTPAAVGLASTGYIDHETGDVLYATENLPGWTGQRLSLKLEAAFGIPAAVGNDAACFALAEAMLGAGQNHRHALVVAIGTGVGGGMIVDGKLYSGWQGRAGAIGHLCVEPTHGRPCTCGLNGCLESYTATRVLVAESGFGSIQALAAAYCAGRPVPAVDEAALWLGRGLASLAHVFGPEVIVVGGSIGLLGERYLEKVRHGFVDHAMTLHQVIPILPAQLQADSGLLGAGILVRLLYQKRTGTPFTA